MHGMSIRERIAPFEPFILEASEKYHVRPQLIKAIISVESSGNPNAQAGTTSARGLMQITRAAAQDMGVAYDNLFDPRTNILCGTEYLSKLIHRNRDDERIGVMAYYAGHGTINDGKITRLDIEARQYAEKVYSVLV